ncbi:CMRF35-like molecule 5 isoform X2 [Ctenopharyngodon idella]|uniref:CMRF35-like molecule 5 isoform X2 n=1 Tax=Ctenopharyngodon idella TaxID=7959 RepID=UPI00222F1222|nr:CMRF35-like molecule 5 isoform X2 [Ctenopharyngodon idella]
MIHICDHKLLIFNLLLIMSVVACEMKEILTFTAYEGGKVEIQCLYESGYETYNKYLCRGECPMLNKDIPVESGSAAKDERFSLTDNTTTHIFTVTITDLRIDDQGQYWCAVRTGLGKYDDYMEIYLEIKHVTSERKSPKPTTTASDHSTEPASEDGGSIRPVTSSASSLPLPPSPSSSVTSLSPQLQLGFTAIIIMLPVMGILMVFGLSSFIYFRLSQRKEGVQSRGVVHVSAENLLTEEATHTICHYEEIICTNNHAGFSLGLPVFGEHDASDTLTCSTVLFQTTDQTGLQ